MEEKKTENGEIKIEKWWCWLSYDIDHMLF
jgi:hypothetical protein